jgi:hypothetical protein
MGAVDRRLETGDWRLGAGKIEDRKLRIEELSRLRLQSQFAAS